MVQISEYVVLVDEQNKVVGTRPKSSVHQKQTPLHRGFSSFIFNSKKEILLQQRSLDKKTWPGIWSNTCCGHPSLNETSVEAADRRLDFELGMKVDFLQEIFVYRYCFSRDEIMENEICPVVVGFSDQLPALNPEEVADYKYLKWEVFLQEVNSQGPKWSEWCRQEANILNTNSSFLSFYSSLNK